MSTTIAVAHLFTLGCVAPSIVTPSSSDSTSTSSTTTSTTSTGPAPTVTFTTPAADGSLAVISNLTTFAIAGACTTAAGTVTIANATATVSATTNCVAGAWSTTINLTAAADGAVALTASQTFNSASGTATRSVTRLATYCLGHSADPDLVSGTPTGNTVGDPYLICSLTQLGDVRNRLAGTKFFRLMTHIAGAGADFVAIAGFSDDTFDGNSLTISNLVFTGASKRGLFEDILGASSVHHLTLSSCTINDVAGVVADYSGLLAGMIAGTSTVSNITITSGSLTTTRAGVLAYFGGLSGYVQGTTAVGSVALSNIQVNATISTVNGASSGVILGSMRDGATLTDATATGSVTALGFSGGAVGYARDATLLRVTSTATVTGTGDYLGGLVGQIANGTTTITDSWATGLITGNGGSGTNNIGGLVGGTGTAGTTISGSYATGNIVAANHDYAGGLVGSGTATISNSYSTGNVTAYYNAGGFVGRNTGAITNSYSTGNVSGYYPVGGFGGELSGTVDRSYATGNATASGPFWAPMGGFVANSGTGVAITDCYAWGNSTSTGAGSVVAGFASDLGAGSSITRSYSKGTVTTTSTRHGFSVGTHAVSNGFWNTFTSAEGSSSMGTGLDDAQSSNLGNYTGFTGSGNWKIDTAISPYPILNWQ